MMGQCMGGEVIMRMVAVSEVLKVSGSSPFCVHPIY